MDKKTFLATLDAERTEWEHAFTLIEETQMLQPGVQGEWSVKDLVAHVVWYEREMVNLLQRRSLEGGSPLWSHAAVKRNARIDDENRERPLAEVLSEANDIFAELRELLEALSDEDLNDPSRMEMPPEWQPWQVIAENTYEHYRHHRAALEIWRAAQSG